MRILRVVVVFLSVLLVTCKVATAAYHSLITSVPGFTGVLPSKHYAGYVKIDGKPAGKKNLFYYFVESERNSSTDPVVLWLNGGPGCSSFDGFVYEHGPFRFGSARKTGSSLPRLHLNPYSWSKVSNMLYLDSPCGVGLSYSEDPNNYVTGDLQTASDSHAFLLKWFKLYPQFLSNPVYISGESYAGVYVPTLASNVVKGIKGGIKPLINFKGYVVGNGIVDDNFDGYISRVPFAYGMGLISPDIFKVVTTNVGFVTKGACDGKMPQVPDQIPLLDIEMTCKGSYSETARSLNCTESLERGFEAVGDVNWYNILEPCYSYPSSSSSVKKKRMASISGHRWSTRSLNRDGRVPLTDSQEATNAFHVPCINDDLATAWLNDEHVRKAIHAAPANVAGAWEICSERVNYTSDIDTILPYHINLTTQGYRALIYSGDHDLVVPFTGTQAWTRSLGYKILDPWRSWLSNSDQVAGYLQGYDKNLTFLTIKGAGHMVPQYKPMEALTFYSRWLGGEAI